MTNNFEKDQSSKQLTLGAHKQKLQEAKALVKQFAKPNDSVVEELISERHEAAKIE